MYSCSITHVVLARSTILEVFSTEDINAMAYEGSSYVRTCWFLKQEKNSALVFFATFYLWKEIICSVFSFSSL